jgi:hypothetical protein
MRARISCMGLTSLDPGQIAPPAVVGKESIGATAR